MVVVFWRFNGNATSITLFNRIIVCIVWQCVFFFGGGGGGQF